MTSFVDAHLHLWDTAVHRHPWLEQEEDLPARFLPADVEDLGAPRGAVFVEADAAVGTGLAEARWVAGLTAGTPWLQGIVAHLDVGTEVAAGDLETLLELPGVVGARRVLQAEPGEFVRSSALAADVGRLGAVGLTFDACVRHEQLADLVTLCRNAPSTTIVLDHLGKPPVAAGWGSEEADRWHRYIRRLADEDGVVVKLSGVAPEAAPGPVGPQVAPFLDAVWDAFGPARTMLGSDWPVSARAGAEDYHRWPRFVLEACGLTTAERHDVAVATAVRVYGLAGRDDD